MNGTIEVVVLVFILGGTLLSLLSSLGLIRLPDVYTRSHALTKSMTLAIVAVLLGGFIYFWFAHEVVSIRLLLGIVFVFITAPVASHLVIRSAYRSGVKLANISVKDELEEDMQELARDNADSVQENEDALQEKLLQKSAEQDLDAKRNTGQTEKSE